MFTADNGLPAFLTVETGNPSSMTDLLETLIENREMVQPNHANMLEVAHGGNVMKWMDEIGAMSAMRFSGETCVTARVNRMNFKRPIPVGDTAYITAYVYDAGTSSVKVRLLTEREDLRTREREKTTESYFVYVAIDEENQPTTVPELTVDTDEGERLRQAALEGENG
ncbi:acyl-CoA hydrolase [Natronococcus occultus SP4]|uniref:Acyl-CoA hydrolase n=2 Tax=Natronococcus occultus TaxID=29288 RepID=L0JZD8_9EURY|nr:acyl-CoA hydrolase [Natronococcus occultus SP4]